MNDFSSEATIGSGTRIRGRIVGEGNLMLEGSIEGAIALRGDLSIGKGGVAASDIDASNVIVEGELDGDVTASGTLHIWSGGTMRGTVRATGGFVLDDGANFAGDIESEFEMPAEIAPRKSAAKVERRK